MECQWQLGNKAGMSATKCCNVRFLKTYIFFIHLKTGRGGGGRKKCGEAWVFHLLFPLQMPMTARTGLGHMKARAQELHMGLPNGFSKSGTWTISCCLIRCISRQLNWNGAGIQTGIVLWNTSQAMTEPAMSQCLSPNCQFLKRKEIIGEMEEGTLPLTIYKQAGWTSPN